MARRAPLFLLTATFTAFIASASSALAGTFSAPIALPGPTEGWHFAVNDHGEGGAVRGSELGATFYSLTSGGSLGSPVAIAIPGKLSLSFPSREQSIAIDSQGRVVVGLLYKDGTFSAECPQIEHCGVGCCGRVAIADWRPGQVPPVAQVLSPRQSADAGYSHQVFSAPSLLIGPSAITALWTREEPEVPESSANEPEPNQTQLVAASGRFGKPLRVKRVITAPRGVSNTHLSVLGSGNPFASWVEDGNKLFGVVGVHSGALLGAKEIRQIPRVSEVEGFANDGGPETLLAYFSDSRNHHLSRLMMMRSSAGHGFSAPREIISIHEASEAMLARRGHFVLAVWANVPHIDEADHLYVQRGSVSGRFGAPQALGLGSNAQAFVDARGQSVIIYRRPVPGSSANEAVAVTAAPGKRFGPPRPLVPNDKDCEPTGGGPFDGQPLALSPDGHAVFSVTCEAAQREQFLIRYTP
jgi:hypothetical protein